MNAPVTAPQGAPEIDPRAGKAARRAAARAAARDEQVARRAAAVQERADKEARRVYRRDLRAARRELRAERAADAAYGAGYQVRRAAPAVFAALPVTAVNATAFIGQLAYIREHVPWVLPGQVLVAATFELVAVYLAWAAHNAQMKNDSSVRLKLGAQMFAMVMGLMNYSHYASGWHPTVMAVGMGLMSLASPSLWGVYSRRASRDRLMAQGLVEPHAVRLGANRWTWHPLRSAQVMYYSTWTGENAPRTAIAAFELARETRRAVLEDRRAARQEEKEGRRAARAAGNGAPGAEQVARRHAPAAQAVLPPAAPAQPLPGTVLNGTTVRAVAGLSADPSLRGHVLSGEQIEVLAERLDAIPLVADLPSQREASKMVCADHDHRRQTNPVLAARRDRGDLPATPLRALRPTSSFVASPVSTLPGGKQANG